MCITMQIFVKIGQTVAAMSRYSIFKMAAVGLTGLSKFDFWWQIGLGEGQCASNSCLMAWRHVASGVLLCR